MITIDTAKQAVLNNTDMFLQSVGGVRGGDG